MRRKASKAAELQRLKGFRMNIADIGQVVEVE
jgi:hypothetical protein